MKALTVKQPWAWALIHGGKDVENRSKPTKYRGQLYIHAGLSWSKEGFDYMRENGLHIVPEGLESGMVIGTVDVISCHHSSDCEAVALMSNSCSQWAMADHYHWVLDNPQPIAPFPAKGMLGIWNLEVPE